MCEWEVKGARAGVLQVDMDRRLHSEGAKIGDLGLSVLSLLLSHHNSIAVLWCESSASVSPTVPSSNPGNMARPTLVLLLGLTILALAGGAAGMEIKPKSYIGSPVGPDVPIEPGDSCHGGGTSSGFSSSAGGKMWSATPGDEPNCP